MAMARACPISWIEIRKGQSRLVILVGSVAIKIPHIKRESELSRCGQVRQGLRCNRAERAAWVRDGNDTQTCVRCSPGSQADGWW